MEEKDKVFIASIAIEKKWDFETLKYSDYMYGRESFTGEVWDYVEECESIGTAAFKEKYKKFKLFI